MASLQKQRGVALITVLMVFAIATLVAGKVIVGKSIDVRRVNGMINRTQAHYYALAAESLAILALREDDQKDIDDKKQGGQQLPDHLEEPWAMPNIEFEIDNIGKVNVQIVDLNRFYNLNNLRQADGLVNEQELERFRNLLVELRLDNELADNLADWLDADDKELGYLSESDAYLNRSPAYRAANKPMQDISELRLVNGFEPEILAVLLPHITVVNTSGVLALNLNTATTYALATLQEKTSNPFGEGLSLSAAQNIVSERPYDDNKDFDNRSGSRELHTSSKRSGTGNNANAEYGSLAHYTLSSAVFEINIRAHYAGHTAYLTTVVQQQGSGNAAKYVVLSRKETDNSWRLAQFAAAAS